MKRIIRWVVLVFLVFISSSCSVSNDKEMRIKSLKENFYFMNEYESGEKTTAINVYLYSNKHIHTDKITNIVFPEINSTYRMSDISVFEHDEVYLYTFFMTINMDKLTEYRITQFNCKIGGIPYEFNIGEHIISVVSKAEYSRRNAFNGPLSLNSNRAIQTPHVPYSINIVNKLDEMVKIETIGLNNDHIQINEVLINGVRINDHNKMITKGDSVNLLITLIYDDDLIAVDPIMTYRVGDKVYHQNLSTEYIGHLDLKLLIDKLNLKEAIMDD